MGCLQHYAFNENLILGCKVERFDLSNHCISSDLRDTSHQVVVEEVRCVTLSAGHVLMITAQQYH